MKIYVYSDESGVFDREHNDYFVFGGIVLLSYDEMNVESRKYSHVEKTIRSHRGYVGEMKASKLSFKDRGKIYRSLNHVYKFGVVIDEKKIHEKIWTDKKHKQRYLDYAYKIGVKRLLEWLIVNGVIAPSDVTDIYFRIDEHSTATSGLYELGESLEQEFKRGVFNSEYSKFFPPIFPNLNRLTVKFINSEDENLIRAADIVANHIYYRAVTGDLKGIFYNRRRKINVTCLP